ncbi:MAG: hypothetical protein K0R81_2756 [Microbacterium sp.]|jgi:hypothetical protein|nr:hypothetical protein [Microbacterium sp.]
MTRDSDVAVPDRAPVDIVPPSAGAAERPGGSLALSPPAVTARGGLRPPTPEDLQHSAAWKESA